MRYAAGALAAMVASADFSETRIADRRMLLGLQARLLTWARGERDTVDGRRLLSDISTAAELLRGVNRRHELRAHDAYLVAALLAEHPRDIAQVRRFLARLRALEGCDDRLDAQVAQALADTSTSDKLAGIRETLGRLAESLKR